MQQVILTAVSKNVIFKNLPELSRQKEVQNGLHPAILFVLPRTSFELELLGHVPAAVHVPHCNK